MNQTENFLRTKVTDSKSYWKQIKPRAKRNPDYISLESFREHFATLFEINVSIILNNYDNYDVYVDTFDN